MPRIVLPNADELLPDAWSVTGGGPREGQPAPQAKLPVPENQEAIRKLHQVAQEIDRRAQEALNLYEPAWMPHQEAFHACRAREVLARGSNRGGKTVTVAVEIARAVTGQDPHDKYPKQGGRCILVGLDQRQLAEVWYYKLFRPGAFKVIKDLETKKWRAYRPWQDAAREAEARPAPPLIPKRLIDGEPAWEDKKRGVPNKIQLTTGWEIMFCASGSMPPHGVDVDLVGFDEEIELPEWYFEMAARLLDRKGRFLWSATPQVSTQVLFDLSERARREENKPTQSIAEFKFLLSKNPFIPDEEKEALRIKYLPYPDQYRTRIEGEFGVVGLLMYPNFNRVQHVCKPFPIPQDWTRYVYVDPGRTVCAVLFMAVPPPHHDLSDQRFFYRELYIEQNTAVVFGRRMLDATQGESYRAFLIDPSAARITGGAGQAELELYSNALKAHNIRCELTGHGFLLADNDREAGFFKVGSWLYPTKETGRPVVQVFEDTCPMFVWEIERYRKKKVNGQITDKPVDQDDHLMDCFRYAAMHDPPYVPPPPPARRISPAKITFDKWMAAEAERFGEAAVNLGPRGGYVSSGGRYSQSR